MRRELVGVNREMSIVKVGEFDEKGGFNVVEINLSTITKDEFIALFEIDKETLTESFFAEIDEMLDEVNNPNVRNDYTSFLVLRDRLIEEFLLYNWQKSGEEIMRGEKTFYDKPKAALSDLAVVVNNKTNEVLTVIGFYTPEFFKAYSVEFDELTREQKVGFIQAMPKEFIDEKMFAYFYNGEGNLKFTDKSLYKKQNVQDYLKLENHFDLEPVLANFAKYNSCLHDYMLTKLYSDEPKA